MSNTKTVAPSWTVSALSIIETAAAAAPSGKLDNAAVKELLNDSNFAGIKTLPSLRGKISNMGLYQKAEVGSKPAAAEGDKPARKLDHVRALETMLSQPVEAFSTFEKASKIQLELMAKCLIELSDAQETA